MKQRENISWYMKGRKRKKFIVSQNRSKIGIDPLIELVPIVRSYSEEGWSNPKKIVDRMLLNLEESRLGVVSYETLLNWFI